MERIKYCLACGSRMNEEADRCEGCGFEGQNRLFLSEQEYEAWKKTVLDPFVNLLKPPKLFAGPRHILILRGNGDLYAVGDNYSGACGENLPEELTEPTLIAKNVRHAAAGATHTIYVTNEGEVRLIGNSDFADRFDCAITARKVYAHYGHTCFLIEDEEGRLYFAGDRKNGDMIPEEYSVFKTLPPVKTSAFEWLEVGNGYNYATGTRMNSQGFRSDAEDFEEIRAYKRCEEFRNLVLTYGDENVQIRLGSAVRKTETGKSYSSRGDYSATETRYELEYEPTVRLYNNWIYQPEPVDPMEEDLNWYHGSWKIEVYKNCVVPEDAGIVRHGCIRGYIEDVSIHEDIKGYIANSAFGIVKSYNRKFKDEAEILPPTAGFVNFAFTENMNNGNVIILVKESGELLLGNADEMIVRGSIDHLQPFRF